MQTTSEDVRIAMRKRREAYPLDLQINELIVSKFRLSNLFGPGRNAPNGRGRGNRGGRKSLSILDLKLLSN